MCTFECIFARLPSVRSLRLIQNFKDLCASHLSCHFWSYSLSSEKRSHSLNTKKDPYKSNTNYIDEADAAIGQRSSSVHLVACRAADAQTRAETTKAGAEESCDNNKNVDLCPNLDVRRQARDMILSNR